MKRRISQLLVGAITVIAFGVFGAVFIRAAVLPMAPPEKEIVPPQNFNKVVATKKETPPIFSERLSIPRLGVDAVVKPVGIAYSGHMSPPPNYRDLGWYKYGPAPGEPGSAVLAGHVDNGFGLAGVFKNLGQIKIGDRVTVVNKQNKRLNFKVTAIDYYETETAPTALIFNDQSGTYLKLITCDGDWLADSKSYSRRLVVTAELI